MKVDPNAPAYPSFVPDYSEYGMFYRPMGGLPARLEIAARLLAGIMAHPTIDPSPEGAAESVLRFTDALIAAHNATQEKPAS